MSLGFGLWSSVYTKERGERVWCLHMNVRGKKSFLMYVCEREKRTFGMSFKIFYAQKCNSMQSSRNIGIRRVNLSAEWKPHELPDWRN